jgi:AbiV family abortive infection protein
MTFSANSFQELMKNADQKLVSAEKLTDIGDFYSASSLTITAFEERTKALVLQLSIIGFPLKINFKDWEYIFSHHDSRSYIGFVVDCLYEIIKDLKVELNKMYLDPEYKLKVLNLLNNNELQNSFLKWCILKMESFIDKIDFFQSIQEKRQNGLYVDILKQKNLSVNRDMYNEIKMKLSSIHKLSEDLIEIKDLIDFTNISESDQGKLKNQFPIILSEKINIIRKERSKYFKKIKKELIDFKEELIDEYNKLNKLT